MSKKTISLQQSHGVDRRRVLQGSAALTAAGWMGGLASGFLLSPKWAHADGPIKMGIATDITGPIAPGGNANWQVAQYAVEQINAGGGILGWRSFVLNTQWK